MTIQFKVDGRLADIRECAADFIKHDSAAQNATSRAAAVFCQYIAGDENLLKALKAWAKAAFPRDSEFFQEAVKAFFAKEVERLEKHPIANDAHPDVRKARKNELDRIANFTARVMEAGVALTLVTAKDEQGNVAPMFTSLAIDKAGRINVMRPRKIDGDVQDVAIREAVSPTVQQLTAVAREVFKPKTEKAGAGKADAPSLAKALEVVASLVAKADGKLENVAKDHHAALQTIYAGLSRIFAAPAEAKASKRKAA